MPGFPSISKIGHGEDGSGGLTHPKQSPIVILMEFTLDSKGHKLFVVEFLDNGNTLSPHIKVNQQDAIRKRVLDDGFQ